MTDPCERFYLHGDQFHRFGANLNRDKPRPSKGQEVYGVRFVCGLVMDDPGFQYEWAHRRLTATEAAKKNIRPCAGCRITALGEVA